MRLSMNKPDLKSNSNKRNLHSPVTSFDGQPSHFTIHGFSTCYGRFELQDQFSKHDFNSRRKNTFGFGRSQMPVFSAIVSWIFRMQYVKFLLTGQRARLPFIHTTASRKKSSNTIPTIFIFNCCLNTTWEYQPSAV